ncbi:MAG: DUF2800 domain-containing protein [Candidatus Ornithomonoglobus sp.]
MPDVHAKRFSPSASCKWLNCPGSVILESEFPDRETDYTREGTLAHSIAELKVLKHFTTMNQKMINARMNILKKDPLYQNEMQGYMLLELDDETIDAGSATVLSNKLLQLCNGAIYTEEHEVIEIHDCKLNAFIECIEGLNGQPVLVFYNFQHDRDRILKALAKSGLTVKVYQGPGEEQEWNSGKIDVLLAHPASTAYGLNLQDGGRNIIWYGLNWSLELYKQANARLHRQGQDKPVVVHRLIVEDSRDSDVAQALEQKDDTQEALLMSLKARIEKAKGE